MADFNGDGKADLAVLGSTGVNVMLGKGDGTFKSPVFYPAGRVDQAMAVGDFNGDGKPDLVVADYGVHQYMEGGVDVLLGNGDGTFKTAAPRP